MPITDYSTTPASNTAISGISVAEGCNASNINDAIRQMMADIASAIGAVLLRASNNLSDLANAATARTNLGLGSLATKNTASLTADVTGVLPVANGGTGGTLPVANGGTGATTAAGARTNIGLGSIATANVTASTSAPSGGADGDIWLQY